MKETQRQMVLLVAFMGMLTVAFLFLFVYAPDPVELPRPDLPTTKEIGSFLLEKFNIFNYL